MTHLAGEVLDGGLHHLLDAVEVSIERVVVQPGFARYFAQDESARSLTRGQPCRSVHEHPFSRSNVFVFG
jgi:hypothetical protein